LEAKREASQSVILGGRLLFSIGCLALTACQAPAELSLCAGQEATDASIKIAAEDEPGERMVIEGRFLVGKQRRPVSGVRLLVYHTNAAGKYARDDTGYLGAYLCGAMRTDEQGRYRIETIRPGPRVNSQTGSHVHFDIRLPWGDRYFDSISFEDDPLLWLPAGERWEEVRPVTSRPDGIQYVERDFWVRR
jgi:protocatechuate 3,4-dioxygenase beta subunit